MKLQIMVAALVLSLLGFAVPSIAQRGGRGSMGMGGSAGPLGVPSNGSGTAGSNYKGLIYGIVKSLNEDAVVLTKTNAGVDQTFKFNKKTKFIHDGKDGSFKSLKVGDEVWVDVGEDKKTGALIARKVVTGVFLMPSY